MSYSTQTPFQQVYSQLSPNDRKAIDEAIEGVRNEFMATGYKVDFSGGITANLDRIFVDPRTPRLADIPQSESQRE